MYTHDKFAILNLKLQLRFLFTNTLACSVAAGAFFLNLLRTTQIFAICGDLLRGSLRPKGAVVRPVGLDPELKTQNTKPDALASANLVPLK
jgi:hypothetical protein